MVQVSILVSLCAWAPAAPLLPDTCPEPTCGDGAIATRLPERVLTFPNLGEVFGKAGHRVSGSRNLLHRNVHGEFDGFRLSAIRRHTLANALGFKNGDILHTVNGHSLASIQLGIDAYRALQDAIHFEIHLTRRGECLLLPIVWDR